jgi:hypothetical protein
LRATPVRFSSEEEPARRPSISRLSWSTSTCRRNRGTTTLVRHYGTTAQALDIDMLHLLQHASKTSEVT